MNRTMGLTVALGCWVAPVTAQSVPTVRLARPDAVFAEPFSQVSGLRALSDGRLIVADRLEKTVSIVDLAGGGRVAVGREGQGPGEYQRPGMLFPLPADTTLLVDLGNLRGLLITPDGRVGETVPFQRADGAGLFFPRAADGRGRLYSQAAILVRDGAATAPDSTPILRLDREGTLDTAGWVGSTGGAGGSGAVTITRGGGPRVSVAARPYQPQDAWAVTADGSLALVRAAPYRVDWVRSDGRRTAGPVLPYEPVRIGKAEKEEWASHAATRIMTVRTPEGSRTISPPAPDIDDLDWPDAKPPFEPAGVLVAPDGEAWIRTSQPAGSGVAVYDVVDGRGRLVRRVRLPDGRRLLGFGPGTLYAAYTDADDLEWLERYERPK